ncbi:hypothetical protein BsWGS_24545 [Bradybaena similaris]
MLMMAADGKLYQIFPELTCCHLDISECAFGTFGAGCKSSCSENCVPSENDTILPCDASTGACLQGCKKGFEGDLCRDILACPPGMFGEDCNLTCSENCAGNSTCHSTTGDCLKGCISGFSGASCLNKCDAGKFGPNCNSSCSQHCVPVKDRTSPCDSVTGTCYGGCQFGFHGDLCQQATSLACQGSSVGHLLAGLCLLLISGSFVSICFWKLPWLR